ncbi:MAG: hypothetical protein IH946_00330 [Bacteroidetes bacterium]|nr:hypothetical protein [Bacteroidota bacterium]
MALPKTLLLICLVTGSILLYAHEQISKTILLYDIQHHQKEKGFLDETHRFLKVQVGILSSSPMLETTLAKEDLLLEFPEDRQVIRLAREADAVHPPKQKRNFLDFLSATKIAEATLR